jgi:hypothetical protein
VSWSHPDVIPSSLDTSAAGSSLPMEATEGRVAEGGQKPDVVGLPITDQANG